MSAVPPIATDSVRRNEPSRRAISRREQSKQHAYATRPSSLDHLSGLCEQARRDSDPDRIRRRQVDDQLEFGRLHDWHVSRLLALENASGIDADLAIAPEVACSI